MVGLLEVDGVHDLDAVALAPQHFPALNDDAALGVCDHERTGVGLAVTLHQVRLEPEAGLTAATPADDKEILIPGRLGVLGAVVHGDLLSLRQNGVILENRVHKGLDVLGRAP